MLLCCCGRGGVCCASRLGGGGLGALLLLLVVMDLVLRSLVAVVVVAVVLAGDVVVASVLKCRRCLYFLTGLADIFLLRDVAVLCDQVGSWYAFHEQTNREQANTNTLQLSNMA